MRIKSDFKDFYDTAQQYFTPSEDRQMVYIRKEQKVELDNKDYPIKPAYYDNYTWGKRTTCIWRLNVIYFCGIWYPFLEIIKSKERSVLYNPDLITTYFKSDFTNKKNAEIVKLCQNPTKEMVKFAEKYGPIFILTYNDKVNHNDNTAVVMIINPELKKYGLQAILNPIVAYDMLYKHVCNQQRPARPIPEMSNDIKIEQKGFDLKTSFRKAKSK